MSDETTDDRIREDPPVTKGEQVTSTSYSADEGGALTVPHPHTGTVREAWWTGSTIVSPSGDRAPGWKARIWCTSCAKPHQHTTPALPARALYRDEQ